MALKREIEKDEFEGLSDEIKKEYKESESGYVLDVLGLEDTGQLKRALDRVRVEKDEFKTKLNEVESKLQTIEGEDARKSGDIEKLEKAWETKLNQQKSEYESNLKAKNQQLRQIFVTNEARAIANEISTSPELIMPHIEARLSVDLDSEEGAKTRVLDSDGKVSALSLKELKQEFVANDKFKAIIISNKASGSGASHKGSKSVGGANATDKVDLTSVSPKALLERINAKKEQE